MCLSIVFVIGRVAPQLFSQKRAVVAHRRPKESDERCRARLFSHKNGFMAQVSNPVLDADGQKSTIRVWQCFCEIVTNRGHRHHVLLLEFWHFLSISQGMGVLNSSLMTRVRISPLARLLLRALFASFANVLFMPKIAFGYLSFAQSWLFQ